jgi:hypothetical protein
MRIVKVQRAATPVLMSGMDCLEWAEISTTLGRMSTGVEQFISRSFDLNWRLQNGPAQWPPSFLSALKWQANENFSSRHLIAEREGRACDKE